MWKHTSRRLAERNKLRVASQRRFSGCLGGTRPGHASALAFPWWLGTTVDGAAVSPCAELKVEAALDQAPSEAEKLREAGVFAYLTAARASRLQLRARIKRKAHQVTSSVLLNQFNCN